MLGIPVATDWRTMGPQFGKPFECLAANVELMTDTERDKLAKEQLDVFLEKSSSREDLPNVLELMIERTVR